MRDNAPTDFALFIHDMTTEKAYKEGIQLYFREQRKRLRSLSGDRGPLAHMFDDVYFADSKYSIGVQLADICAYIINRHLCGGDDTGLYEELRPNIIFSQVEPSRELPADPCVLLGNWP
jgi:hypothetical protein